MKLQHLFGLGLLLIFAACKPEAVVPSQSQPIAQDASIYPDYRDIVIPPNIAPLNIQVKSAGTAFVGEIKGRKGVPLLAAADEDGKLQFDTLAWRNLLAENKGGDLSVTLYAERDGGWVRHPSYALHVAPEPIDPYLSYRLIEPSYELYRQLGLYQRNLTNFEETPIYENNSEFDMKDNHCVNCHNYQNNGTERMLFHVRAEHGGTVFVDNGQVRRVDMKNDSILSNSVYPTWHPKRPWVVFSSNLTGQAFPMMGQQKVEVVDFGSDLLFYDVERNKISNVLKTDSLMETFPAWTPDGQRLYYCMALLPQYSLIPDSLKQNKNTRSDVVMSNYKEVRYNLWSMAFDPRTRSFSAPRLEVDCAAMGKSASLPRVSPDGRFLLFTLGDFGQFHIWHKSSDLWVKDLKTGDVRPLGKANSADVDSYHTWSSNGRWMVFSSRRDDGSFTRPYIAYFDEQGRDYKAFLLPQEDPESNLSRMKSYNVPELTREKVKVSPEQFREVIYNDEGVKKVEYGK